MKPVSISDYLEHIGRAPGEAPPPKPSPFRPRSLPAAPFASDRAATTLAAFRPRLDERAQRSALERKAAADASQGQAQAEREVARAREIEARVAEAYARGRAEGTAFEREQGARARAEENEMAKERTLMERLEFELNEYAALETAIRAGFLEIETRVGEAVARILAPFLMGEVVAQAADELVKAIQRLCAGGAPGLIAVRGPARVLSLLRERVADLPVEVDYVESDGVEAVVEAGATRIATQLQPWADWLADVGARNGAP